MALTLFFPGCARERNRERPHNVGGDLFAEAAWQKRQGEIQLEQCTGKPSRQLGGCTSLEEWTTLSIASSPLRTPSKYPS